MTGTTKFESGVAGPVAGSSRKSLLDYLEYDWDDEEEDERGGLGLFVDRVFVPTLLGTVTSVSALIASVAIYMLLLVWREIGLIAASAF